MKWTPHVASTWTHFDGHIISLQCAHALSTQFCGSYTWNATPCNNDVCNIKFRFIVKNCLHINFANKIVSITPRNVTDDHELAGILAAAAVASAATILSAVRKEGVVISLVSMDWTQGSVLWPMLFIADQLMLCVFHIWTWRQSAGNFLKNMFHGWDRISSKRWRRYR